MEKAQKVTKDWMLFTLLTDIVNECDTNTSNDPVGRAVELNSNALSMDAGYNNL